MFNARETLNLLVDSPALDGLLAEASKHASAITPDQTQSVADSLEEFDKKAADLQFEGDEAAEALREVLQEKQAARQAKVATALRILEVSSRLVG